MRTKDYSFVPKVSALHAGLEPGMVLSNEPGYYADGAFGIRIENMMLVVPAETPHQIEGKRSAGVSLRAFRRSSLLLQGMHCRKLQ